MDCRCGETMSFKTVQKPHMKKSEVRVMSAPVWVFSGALPSETGRAVVFSMDWVLNSPGKSLNSNAVIVPQCGPREKSFLREICVEGNRAGLKARKRDPDMVGASSGWLQLWAEIRVSAVRTPVVAWRRFR